MNPRVLFASLCLALLAPAVSAQLADPNDPNPIRGRFFVSPFGDDKWTGGLPFPNKDKSDGPFATLKKAQEAHRAATIRSTIYVRKGTYYLEEPLQLGPLDSGSAYVAFPNETVILSGGREIKDWKKSPSTSWSASVPEIRSDKWAIDQLRVGEQRMTLARHPNLPPAATVKDGWIHTVYEGPKGGKMGAAISGIHNPGDMIDWVFPSRKAGEHYVWLFYSAQNAAKLRVVDVGPRMTLRANGDAPTPLMNVRDTRGFTWARVAKVTLMEGENLLRWENKEGGYLSLDAIALCDDVRWNPAAGRSAAAGSSTILIQAESFKDARAEELETPETTANYFKDRFSFKFGDFDAYDRTSGIQVHMFPAGGEVNTILQVRVMDPRRKMIQVSLGPNASLEIREGNRYYMANFPKALDAPGEWYADLRRSSLYLIPSAANFMQQGVVAPKLDRVIDIRGNEDEKQWIQDVMIKGFILRDTMFSPVFDPMNPVDAAIHVSMARNCVIEGNRFLDVGGHAVRVEKESERVEIVGNEISGAGQGGILFIGSNEDQPRNNLVAGNYIHDIGQILKGVAAIRCATASTTQILNNRIENTPRQAIHIVNRDARSYSHNTIIQHNVIKNTCMETADGAAIEVYGRHKMETKTLINNNWIENIRGVGTDPEGGFLIPHDGWGINLSVYGSGVTITGNTIISAHSGLIAIQGGRNNLVSNNVLVNGDESQVFVWPVDTFCEGNTFTKNISYFGNEEGSFIAKDGTWNPKAIAQSNQNIFWHRLGEKFFRNPDQTPLGTFAQWQQSAKDIDSLFEDPGFESLATGKYQLTPSNPARQKIGFNMPDYPKQGLAGYDRAWKVQ